MSSKILIVDDEKQICTAIGDYLSEQGYQVFEANGIMDVRTYLKSGLIPDVIVCDVMLQDGNGIIFIRELRQSPATKAIPIIMMSAHRTRSQDKVLGLEFGADDYLSKPFDLRELRLRIEKLVKQKQIRSSRVGRSDIETPPEPNTLTDALMEVFKTNPHDYPVSPNSGEDKSQISSPDSMRVSWSIKLLNLLLNPIKFFAEDASRSQWFGPLILAITGFFFGLQQGFSEKSWGQGFVGILIYPAVLAGVTGILAWSMQWMMGLKDSPVRIKNFFTMISLSFAPLMVTGLLGLIYVISVGGRAGDFTAGPLLIFPNQTSSQFLGYCLRRIDIFELWSLGLLILALSHAAKRKWPKVFFWSVTIWIFTVVISAYVRKIFV